MNNLTDLAKINKAEKELAQLEAQYSAIAAEASLAGASMLPPPAGTAADIASLVVSLSKGNWGDALIDAVGFIPIGGDAVKAAIKGPKIVAQKNKIQTAIEVARVKLVQAKLALKTDPKKIQEKTAEACNKSGIEPCPKMGGGKGDNGDVDSGTIKERDVSTVITHRAGNRQVDIDDQRWNVPKDTPIDKIPSTDSVGDALQKSTREAAESWNPKRNLTRNERVAIAKARDSDEYWRANLLEKQAKGRWVEKQVKKNTENMGLDVQWSKTGADVTDAKTGIKYDIMSGTKSNMDTHAKRMSDDLFRMITF